MHFEVMSTSTVGGQNLFQSLPLPQIPFSPCWWRVQSWGPSPASIWLWPRRWRGWRGGIMTWWLKRNRRPRPWMMRQLSGCGKSAADWWVWKEDSQPPPTHHQKAKIKLDWQSQRRRSRKTQKHVPVLWDRRSTLTSERTWDDGQKWLELRQADRNN